MLEILEKIYKDECKYFKWDEFKRISNWIANTIDCASQKSNNVERSVSFASIGFSGTPADAMLEFFDRSEPISKKLKSLEYDEEGAAKYIKQLLLFYGVGAALYNRYFDDIIKFDYNNAPHKLVLETLNIYQWKQNTVPAIVLNFSLYGFGRQGDVQINFIFDDSNDYVSAEIGNIKATIDCMVDCANTPNFHIIRLSNINDEVFIDCTITALDADEI